MEAAEWNPDLAFALAESYALSVIQAYCLRHDQLTSAYILASVPLLLGRRPSRSSRQVRREVALLQQRGRSEALAAVQAKDNMSESQNGPVSFMTCTSECN